MSTQPRQDDGRIVLRAATTADFLAIAAVFTASRDLLTFLPRLHTPEEDRAFITGHVLPTYRVTVAEAAGEITGYIAEHDGWVEQLYVGPAWLRAGIGSRLLDDAKARNDHLELWCFAENRRARAFYERHGFVPLAFTNGAENEEKAADVRYRWERTG